MLTSATTHRALISCNGLIATLTASRHCRYNNKTHPPRPGACNTGNMHELQGPALLQFDSATFKEDDWTGLMSFGEGSASLPF